MTVAAKIEQRVHIIQGEFFVTDDADVVISTILGSCVAACMRDPIAKVGGMNHFLLPGKEETHSVEDAERFGVHLMEVLVNGLLKAGARRERLEAKLFGGAQTGHGLSNIGKSNSEFAKRFLAAEGIAHVGGDVGGPRGRRIQYWPVSGRARQILLAAAEKIETPKRHSIPVVDTNAGELELF